MAKLTKKQKEALSKIDREQSIFTIKKHLH
jgi:hypothetical protein